MTPWQLGGRFKSLLCSPIWVAPSSHSALSSRWSNFLDFRSIRQALGWSYALLHSLRGQSTPCCLLTLAHLSLSRRVRTDQKWSLPDGHWYSSWSALTLRTCRGTWGRTTNTHSRRLCHFLKYHTSWKISCFCLLVFRCYACPWRWCSLLARWNYVHIMDAVFACGAVLSLWQWECAYELSLAKSQEEARSSRILSLNTFTVLRRLPFPCCDLAGGWLWTFFRL